MLRKLLIIIISIAIAPVLGYAVWVWEHNRSAAPPTEFELQARLVDQLTWDPRPVDVYLQRLLMLTESGAGDRIRPTWVRDLLGAQLPDGAWTNTPVLLPLPGARDLVWTRNGIGPGRAVGSFHTTVQGIYLLSLMLHGQGDVGRL